MKALTGTDVLEMWEQGVRLPVGTRPVAMLALGYPELDNDVIDHLPIGERDRLLLQLRASLSGPDLEMFAACPVCGQEVEFQVGVGELLATEVSDGKSTQTVSVSGHSVTFRLPNSSDALAVSRLDTVDEARRELLRRCVLEAHIGNMAVPIDDLPAEGLAAVEDAMESADPLADIRFSLACPACGSTWDAPFDPASFLWAELSAGAERLLKDVHALAGAYGWAERDILRMSESRRAAYREMIG